MVRAFRRMLEDAEFRQRCCKNARDYARQKFNWQNYGERLMNIYAIEISRNSRTGNL
jgi:glycosyltransferase involved in cell wall biosynthesis